MTETATIDEKIAEMGHAIAKLTKTVEEKDLQITTLMNKLEVQNRRESNKGHSHTHQHTSQGAHKSFQRRLMVHKGALPQFHLYQFRSCRT